jgi:hypothetical protein
MPNAGRAPGQLRRRGNAVRKPCASGRKPLSYAPGFCHTRQRMTFAALPFNPRGPHLRSGRLAKMVRTFRSINLAKLASRERTA